MRSPVQLPPSDHLRRVVIDQRDTPGTVVAIRSTQCRHEDAARSTVHRMRARVTGLGCQLSGLDRVRHHRPARVRLGVEHIRGRRTNARDEQVAPLERLPVIAGVVAAMPVVAQRTRACAPPEVVQLVGRRRQLGPADHAAIRRRFRVAVHHRERILRLTRRVESNNIGQQLGRSRHSGTRAAVKRGICRRHDSSSAFAGPPSGYLVSRGDSQVSVDPPPRMRGCLSPGRRRQPGWGRAGRERDDDGLEGVGAAVRPQRATR